MPTPHPKDETRDEWMARCVPVMLDEGTAQDASQAAAICASMWEDAKKASPMKMERAYSVLNWKAVDEDKRELSGIATTPTPDRMGDIIEPKGAKFALPLPLLWQHNSREPIGHVTHAKVTDAGIEVRAKLAHIEEPGPLRDRLEMAWQSIKSGLVRGLSIGFRSIEHSRLDDSFGLRFREWEWMELSAVTIPANADCSILAIKTADQAIRRATFGARPVVRLDNAPAPAGAPHVSGTPARRKGVVYIKD